MADVDLSRLPVLLGTFVRRVDPETGRPSKAQLDYDQLQRGWFVTTTVDLQTKITDLRSETDANAAAVHQETIARTDADGALAAQITSLTATVGTTQASVSQEAQARATADSALAYDLNAVSTTVGGHSAEISQLQASVDGSQVRWQIQATIDGSTGGITFDGIRDSTSGATYMLTVNANARFTGDVVIDGTLTTRTIAQNAMSALSEYYDGNTISTGGTGNWNDVAVVTVGGLPGAFLWLLCNVQLATQGNGSGASAHEFRVVKIVGSNVAELVPTSNQQGGVYPNFVNYNPIAIDNDASQPSITYKFQIRNTTTNNPGRTYWARERKMQADLRKR